MKVERITVGSGITARVRETRTADTVEEIKDLLNKGPKAQPYSEYIGALEEQASRWLKERGLPYKIGGWWCRPDGSWVFAADEPWPLGVMVSELWPALTVRLGHAVDSGAGYAARILRLVAEIRAANSKNDTERAMCKAHDLGALVTESKFKRLYENATLRGIKVREASRQGGKAKAESAQVRNVTMARDFQKLRNESPMQSESAAKASIGRKYGLKRSAAITAINNGLEEIVRNPAKPD
jgi:hypothetical protein